MQIIEMLRQPWHWSLAGAFVGATVPMLLLLGNKKLGISSSFRHACAICVPAQIPFFQYNWKSEIWNLFFVMGIIMGGFAASHWLMPNDGIAVAQDTKLLLSGYGITNYSQLLPADIYNLNTLFSLKGVFLFVFGGFLVGFGTRYAGGCTSGHTIMGLSTLQLSSLFATLSFMLGGFVSANILLPIIFKYL